MIRISPFSKFAVGTDVFRIPLYGYVFIMPRLGRELFVLRSIDRNNVDGGWHLHAGGDRMGSTTALTYEV